MKNTQLLKALILVLTFGSLATADLKANNEIKESNDTTEVQFLSMQTPLAYSLIPMLPDEFSKDSGLEINPYLKQPSAFETFAVSTDTEPVEKPRLDLKKFHRDDAFNSLENSIQENLTEYHNTQTIYRDYFKIPLNLSKK